MKYNDLATKALTTNPELKDEAAKTFDQLKTYQDKYNNLDNRDEYADVRVAKTARFIGDEIAQKSKGYITAITSQDVRRAAADIEKENPGWLATHKRDIDYLEQHNNQIPLAGFPGGFKSGLYDIGENIAT